MDYVSAKFGACASRLTLERPGICPYLERPQWVIFDPCTKAVSYTHLTLPTILRV